MIDENAGEAECGCGHEQKRVMFDAHGIGGQSDVACLLLCLTGVCHGRA